MRMNREDLLELSDVELLKKAKKLKYDTFINALLIGFCIGIVVWSVAKNTWGFLTLIPLFFIYKMVNKSKNDEELKAVLKERNIK
ncbi:FUSC family protein [Mariniflexile sp. AS56]|uniref:FUSC family protein n=1 Tax=Mariniflexile sp. AS56 TaxID=3063957 RepID=UPI0026F04197|nr:FUSC family protein [Mariniflexile sp. AS56]MDO7171240.1 FUSC family protein [Mariniflexile sp. AS56]